MSVSDTDEQPVRRDLVGSVLVLTLDRPEKANTLTRAAMTWIADAVTEAVNDDAVRAVLIRAEGRNFSAGADLVSANAVAEKPRVGYMVRQLDAAAHRMIETVWDCTLPTVAAVQGRAAGVGLHLALACDFVVAGDSASFLAPFANLGFSADSGGTWLLPRLVGLTRAKHMLIRGLAVPAAQALDWGLVAEAHPDAELDAAARALADELAARPTFSVELTKRMINQNVHADLHAALANEAAAVQLSLYGEDFKEGLKAFMGRRDAEFTGR
jgi:2-(1,2-epoxy-1,2-dihydrophenyl)acetyl-CoA isomerase